MQGTEGASMRQPPFFRGPGRASTGASRRYLPPSAGHAPTALPPPLLPQTTATLVLLMLLALSTYGESLGGGRGRDERRKRN